MYSVKKIAPHTNFSSLIIDSIMSKAKVKLQAQMGLRRTEQPKFLAFPRSKKEYFKKRKRI